MKQLDCKIFVLALSMLICFKTIATDQHLLKTEIQINNGSCAVISNGQHLVNNGRFIIIDGKDGRKLNSKTQAGEYIPEKKPSFNEVFLQDKIEVRHELSSKGHFHEWAINVVNKGSECRWLELRLELPVTERIQKYWDGSNEYSVNTKITGAREFSTFPLSACYDENRGVALGIAPDALVSYMQGGFENGAMSFSVRAAIPAGEAFKLKYVIFAFAQEFSYLDAVNIYQGQYPRYFRRSCDIDPRLFSGTDTLQFARRTYSPGNAMAITGGFGAFEWGYAPFRRVGDWLARKELWDWPMSNEEQKRIADRSERTTHYNVMDYDKFRKGRRNSYFLADERYNVLVSYYIINWMEGNLLKSLNGEKYVYDYASQGSKLSWVTATSDEYHVFPWANVFETTIRNDMPELIKELNFSAIALDIAGNPSPYRGKLAHYIQGWTYDQNGEYIATDIGNAHLLDYLRGFKNDRHSMGVIANGYSPYQVAVRTDSIICESKGQPERKYEDFRRERLLQGDKIVYLHSGAGFANPALDIDWRNLSQEEIKLYYQDYLNKNILGYYQGGYIPSISHIAGNETLTRAMPILLDVLNRGYRCSPACKGNSELKRVRYGDGLQSIIVISNPTSETISAEETVIGSYFGATPLPAPYRDGKTKFKFNANRVIVDLTIARNQNELLAIPLALQQSTDALPSFSGEAVVKADAHRLTWHYELHSQAAGKVKLLAMAPPGFKISSLKLNSKAVAPEAISDLTMGKNTLELECLSETFLSRESDLLSFAYEKSKIIAEIDDDARIRGVAGMLQDFFGSFAGVKIPIISQAEVGGMSLVLKKGPNHGIKLNNDGNSLIIEAKDSFAVQQLCSSLIRMIYQKRGYVLPYGGNLPLAPTRDMLKKIGIDGNKYFPFTDTRGKRIPETIKTMGMTIRDENKNETIPELNVPTLEGTIIPNGKLEESMWKKAAVIDQFMPLHKGKFIPGDEKTEAKLFFTQDHLWIGVLCHEPEIAAIPVTREKRDSMDVWNLKSRIELYLAPGVGVNKKENYPFYQLVLNISGNIWDAFDKDESWNGNWNVSVFKGANYWSAKIGIPLTELGESASSDQWRFNIARCHSLRQIYSTWSPVTGILHNPEKFGVIKRNESQDKSTSKQEDNILSYFADELKKSGEVTALGGTIKEVIFGQNEKYYGWLLKSARAPFTQEMIDSVNIYINCDPQGQTGRNDIIGGADWRLIIELKQDFFKLEKYKDILPEDFKKPNPFSGKVHGVMIPKYACSVTVVDGNILFIIEKDYFQQNPLVGKEFNYYITVYKDNKILSAGVTKK